MQDKLESHKRCVWVVPTGRQELPNVGEQKSSHLPSSMSTREIAWDSISQFCLWLHEVQFLSKARSRSGHLWPLANPDNPGLGWIWLYHIAKHNGVWTWKQLTAVLRQGWSRNCWYCTHIRNAPPDLKRIDHMLFVIVLSITSIYVDHVHWCIWCILMYSLSEVLCFEAGRTQGCCPELLGPYIQTSDPWWRIIGFTALSPFLIILQPLRSKTRSLSGSWLGTCQPWNSGSCQLVASIVKIYQKCLKHFETMASTSCRLLHVIGQPYQYCVSRELPVDPSFLPGAKSAHSNRKLLRLCQRNGGGGPTV